MIKVEINIDFMGNLQIDPVNKRYRNQCVKKIIENHKQGHPKMHSPWQKERTEKWLRSQACVYIQRDYDVKEALEFLTNSERKHFNMGYTLVKLMDEDTFEHYFFV